MVNHRMTLFLALLGAGVSSTAMNQELRHASGVCSGRNASGKELPGASSLFLISSACSPGNGLEHMRNAPGDKGDFYGIMQSNVHLTRGYFIDEAQCQGSPIG
jgi:hypothetical protein